MKTTPFDEIVRKHLTPDQIEKVEKRVEKELLRLNLKALRELTGKTQVETAKAAKMTQGELSKQERRTDHLVSTLRRHVRALGGELELIARFGDRTIKLTGV